MLQAEEVADSERAEEQQAAQEAPEARPSFAAEEGFGTVFKCLAVTPKGLAPPFPFQE